MSTVSITNNTIDQNKHTINITVHHTTLIRTDIHLPVFPLCVLGNVYVMSIVRRKRE